jgi:hypothetical protein
MRSAPSGLLAVILLATVATGKAYADIYVTAPDTGVKSLYAQNTASAITQSTTLVAIPGLTFTLPAQSKTSEFALVTLNVPNVNVSTYSYCGFAIAAAKSQYAVAYGTSGVTLVTKFRLLRRSRRF